MLTTGIEKITCTCGKDMALLGGRFGGNGPITDTYYCSSCQKHIIVVTPKQKEQDEFIQRLRELRG